MHDANLGDHAVEIAYPMTLVAVPRRDELTSQHRRFAATTQHGLDVASISDIHREMIHLTLVRVVSPDVNQDPRGAETLPGRSQLPTATGSKLVVCKMLVYQAGLVGGIKRYSAC